MEEAIAMKKKPAKKSSAGAASKKTGSALKNPSTTPTKSRKTPKKTVAKSAVTKRAAAKKSPSAAALQKYRQMRNFDDTPEPAGGRQKKSATLSFVIQKHAASHLHYDFRLELDGTLKSWAVPKGPSLDPADKRLAMHVEDHPLDYANFEGTIPAGNYGAGTVIVWDRGEWIPHGDATAAYQQGKLKFELRGEKLHGGWTLVKSHGRYKENGWLLIKERDEAARPAAEFNVVEQMPDSVLGGKMGEVWQSNRSAQKMPPEKKSRRAAVKTKITMPDTAKAAALPLMLAPQLAMLADTPPRGNDWSYELKLDGYRVVARIANGEVRLFTRNGNDWTAKLKHIAAALATLALDNAWLDGEIVMLDANDRPSFQLLQNAFESSRTEKIQFFLFDIPYLNGFDLRSTRLDERRRVLEQLLASAKPPLVFSATLDMPVAQLYKHACDLQLEGLIGKRNSSPYRSTRSNDWIKLKCLQRQEFVIGGFTDSSRPGPATFGSLLLGLHESDGRLRYAGRVGTGFTQASLNQLAQKMRALEIEKMPFDIYTGEKATRKVHWIKPSLVCEVAFTEWTTGGHARHPSFMGLRDDKPAQAVTTEKTVSAQTLDKKTAKKTAAPRNSGIEITHGERIVDPKSGTTKRELIEFYAQIAPALLPHLRNRPVSLVRAPAGIDGQLFFQKHLQHMEIAHVTELKRGYFPEHPPLLNVATETALLACAQMNVIEFHTWNSTLDDGEHPDRIVFDLDPGEGIVWKQIQQSATLMKTLLDQLHLTSFLKTSGGKGLHVIVPIVPELGWDTVKDFAAAVVRHMANTLPTLFVAKSGPRNRINRIFIDYLRNGLGATTVSAFSVRARAGLGVSVPVAWEELPDLRGADHWTVANATERLDKQYKRVWATYEKSAQRLHDAMQAIGFEH